MKQRQIVLVLTLSWPASGLAKFEAGWKAGQSDDHAAAWREYRPLAEQGDADAQNNLGYMYGYGFGVPKDRVQAYAWLNLAAAQGHKLAIESRDIVSKEMTPSQIEEGQKLRRELFKRISKNK